MSVLRTFFLTISAGLLLICAKSNPVTITDTGIDPFTTNGNLRNLIVVISDLHLGVSDSFAECQANRATLVTFLNRVAVKIPVMEALSGAASAAATDTQASMQYFLNPDSDKRIVVFGHSHEAKIVPSLNHNGLKSIYANSGTWIDRNSGRTTMDFVVITPPAAAGSTPTYVNLYHYQSGSVAELAMDSTNI